MPPKKSSTKRKRNTNDTTATTTNNTTTTTNSNTTKKPKTSSSSSKTSAAALAASSSSSSSSSSASSSSAASRNVTDFASLKAVIRRDAMEFMERGLPSTILRVQRIFGELPLLHEPKTDIVADAEKTRIVSLAQAAATARRVSDLVVGPTPEAASSSTSAPAAPSQVPAPAAAAAAAAAAAGATSDSDDSSSESDAEGECECSDHEMDPLNGTTSPSVAPLVLTPAARALEAKLNASNERVVELSALLKREMMEVARMVSAIKIFVQLQIPKMETAHNFGVNVQEESIGELGRVEDSSFTLLDSLAKYRILRAKLVSRCLKYPMVLDYQQSVHELDEKQYLNLQLHALDLRNNTATVYDQLMKNKERILKPRGESSHLSMM